MEFSKKLKTITLLGLVILIVFSSSCGKDDEVVIDDSVNLGVNLDATLALSIVNGHRRSGATCGSDAMAAVANLEWSEELAKAALAHSNDMQVNNYFNHTSQNGDKFSDRARAAGFEGFPVGENIARGQQSVESVMQAWMKSAGHCRNIMNPNATLIGVARSDEGAFWTMVLGKK